MKPGEIITLEGDLILNQEMTSFELNVSNSGDRPIQVGSHFHFSETNEALKFDRKILLYRSTNCHIFFKNVAVNT